MDFAIRSSGKAMPRNQIWRKNSPGLRLCWWFKHPKWKCQEIEWILGGLRVHGAKVGLKINVKKSKSLRLSITEGDEVILGNKKIELQLSR